MLKQTRKNILSDISISLPYFLPLKINKTSEEESFIKKHNLYNAINQAYSSVAEIFGNNISTSLEYCKESELEWLDFNLQYDSVKDEEIESLLDKVDELSSEFENKVGIGVASNINFYLDIK
ncbi:MAG: hypothetical protein HQK65_22275 [Desulfamplus sp.]|nr:hypothetical protein [Desulfamplus sp.]